MEFALEQINVYKLNDFDLAVNLSDSIMAVWLM